MKQLTWLCVLSGLLFLEATAAPELYLTEPGKQAGMHRRREPWKKWAKDPLFIPISVEVTDVYAETNTTVEIKLADGLSTAYGYNCYEPTNAPNVVANLSVRREYYLTVVASNLTSVSLNVLVQPTWEPLDAKGSEAAPKDYAIFIDRALGSTITASTNCAYYSNAWLVEVRDKRPARWYADDGSDDPRPAPGDGAFLEMGPGKSLATNRIALDWSVSLGRLFDGTAAGRLRVREHGLTEGVYTPAVIYYTANSEAVRNQVELVAPQFDGVLRQVKAYQSFVDLVQGTNQTTLDFYRPSQVATNKDASGVYTNITGSPFVSWFLRNPEPATSNRLHLIESRNGLSRTNSLVYDSQSTSNTWTLRYGTGAEERMETRGVTFSYSPNTNRLETVVIRYASSNTPAYKCVEKYRMFEWGWELVETDVDPDNSHLVTTIDFNENEEADPYSYGKPSIINYPDGHWEQRRYFNDPYMDYFLGALHYVLRPDEDLPQYATNATLENCYVVEYEYNWADGTFSGLTHYRQGIAFTNQFRIDDVQTFPWYDKDVYIEGLYIREDGTYTLGVKSANAYEFHGKGLAGHPYYWRNDREASLAMYYNTGVYHPTSGVFVVNTNIDAYTNVIGDGPDWRQSVIYYGYPEHLEAGEYELIEVTQAEGQPLYENWWYTGLWLTPKVSHKEARIYQSGSLVRRELSVFTGVETNEPLFEVFQTYVYQNDSLGHPTNVTVFGGTNAALARVLYEADYRGTNSGDGDLLLWESDETGIRTEYLYDSLKRVVKVTKKGVVAAGGFPAQADIITMVDYDAYGRQFRQVTSAGSLGLTNTWVYDLAGRPVQNTDASGLTTSNAYLLGGRCVVTTLPTGASDIRTNYLDRRLFSRTGSGVVAEFHDYWQTNERSSPWMWRVTMMEKVTYGSEGSARGKTIGTDWLALPVRWESFDYDGNNTVLEYHFYSYWLNQPNSIQRSGKSAQFISADYDGSVGKTEIGPWDALDSTDRITRRLKQFKQINGDWFHVETNLTYLVDYSAEPTVTSVRQERLSGFASSSILSETTTWDADTNAIVVTTYVDRTTKKLTQVTDTPQSTLNATNITINGLLQWESTPTVASPTRRYYDALGRQTSVVSPLGFTATTAYNQYGQVTSVTDFTGQTTSYEYYANGQVGAGQVKCQTQNGKKTYYSYTSRGELYRTWGDVPYPEQRIYSDYGELVQLHTFRGGTDWSNPAWPTGTAGTYDTTTWNYQEHSGLLTNKTDAAGKALSYAYTNGVLWTRTWARMNGTNAIAVTNLYNDFGDLAQMEYTDGTPTVAFNNYNRTGLPREIVDATGTNVLTYDHASRLTLTTNIGGLLAGLAISNRFDGLHGRDQIRLLGSSPTLTHDYRYEVYGRLAVVSNGVYSATYGYLANADLLQTTTCKSNTTAKLTTTRAWEYGSRLSAILNQAGSTMVSSHGYQYDALNRRTRAALEDGSYWLYDYNDRNELTGARHYWPDQSPISGQHFGYGYDTIGNRQSARSGGDVNGWNLRETTYTANGLNQYTSIVTPGYEDIAGVTWATNTVTVNSGEADRKVEYFHREITVGNGSDPVWQDVTVSSGGVSSNGGFVFPKNSQTLTYDLDGNLTFDGVWTYEWDGENRLKAMTMTNVSGIPDAQRKKLEFGYDFTGRRVQKVVSSWNGSGFGSPVTNQFVYDGWNLLAELDTSHSALRTYMLGQDLSGTMDQAGGIGGLLLVVDHVPQTDTFHFACYDGNGNITALMNASDQSLSARYEYSPYGELLRSTGPLAAVNPFRWSTKFWDEESGLVYYGYRYYSPSLGRWMSRDPIEEDGGVALYGFVLNSPLANLDPDGQGIIQMIRNSPRLTKFIARSALIGLLGVKAAGRGSALQAMQVAEDFERRARTVRVESNARGKKGVGTGGRGGWAGTVVQFELVWMEGTYRAIAAAAAVVAGMAATDPIQGSLQTFFRNVAQGNAGAADLDAIDAALQMTGGVASDALVAWFTFDEVGQVFDEF